jgi:hypothetical protein
MEGMGKGFVNGWYMLGHMLGKAGMLNGEIEADQQMAMMNVMGIDTGNIEAASILNTAVLAEIDTSEKLFELDNQAQEVGANAEAALELLFLVKGLTQGAVKIAGRAGRSGVKVARRIDSTPSKLNKADIKKYLLFITSKSREDLISDIKSLGLKAKGQSPDGRFIEFVDSQGKVRVKIHPADKVTKNSHLHIYDSQGRSVDSNLDVTDFRSANAHIKIQD